MKSALHTELQNKAQQYLLDKSYWITNVEKYMKIKITKNEKETLIAILKDYSEKNFKRLGTCDLLWIEDFIKKLEQLTP